MQGEMRAQGMRGSHRKVLADSLEQWMLPGASNGAPAALAEPEAAPPAGGTDPVNKPQGSVCLTNLFAN